MIEKKFNRTVIPLIFCSGKGTRMGEITKNTPKPLLKIENDKTFLDYNLDFLVKNKFSEVFVNYSYRRDLFLEIKKKYKNKIKITLIKDEPPLGQGGVIMKYKKYFQKYGTIFTINGDTVYNFDFQEFLAKHNKKQSSLSVLSSKKCICEKNLLCNIENKIFGIITNKQEYLYSKKSQRIIYQNNLGAMLLNTKKLFGCKYAKGFLGIFGKEDVVEILTREKKYTFCIEVKIDKWLSANTPEDLAKIRKTLSIKTQL